MVTEFLFFRKLSLQCVAYKPVMVGLNEIHVLENTRGRVKEYNVN